MRDFVFNSVFDSFDYEALSTFGLNTHANSFSIGQQNVELQKLSLELPSVLTLKTTLEFVALSQKTINASLVVDNEMYKSVSVFDSETTDLPPGILAQSCILKNLGTGRAIWATYDLSLEDLLDTGWKIHQTNDKVLWHKPFVTEENSVTEYFYPESQKRYFPTTQKTILRPYGGLLTEDLETSGQGFYVLKEDYPKKTTLEIFSPQDYKSFSSRTPHVFSEKISPKNTLTIKEEIDQGKIQCALSHKKIPEEQFFFFSTSYRKIASSVFEITFQRR